MSLVEHLRQDQGHTVLVLRESGIEDTARVEGLQFQAVQTWGRWHPSLRVLSGWSQALEGFQPEVLLGLEEPYSVQSALFLQWARRRSIPFVFLSCQNIDRLLPYPFGVLESWVLSHSQGAWFLNCEAAARARRRGFWGTGRVIPLGVEFHGRPPGRCVEPTKDEEPVSITPDPCGERIPVPAMGDFTVGYAGRLVPEKGVDDLIRACSLAGVRLLVAGEGPERRRLENLARELKAESVWLGRTASTHMEAVYSQMDALVLPSISTPRWKEQFGRVLVEAMAWGVPVVGSTSGEIPYVVGDAGLLFPEGDSISLSKCLISLKEDPDLRASLSRAGQKRVRTLFSWSWVAHLLNDLILSVIYRNP